MTEPIHLLTLAEHKFNGGKLVATPGVVEIMRDDPDRIPWVSLSLRRHVSGDWGDLDDEDKRLNDQALEHGSRLLSAYELDDVKIWIITEADRSATTILLPSEY